MGFVAVCCGCGINCINFSITAGIISLLAGMAALLHLKVVRASEDKEDDTLLFSDVALGQTKARMHYFKKYLLVLKLTFCIIGSHRQVASV